MKLQQEMGEWKLMKRKSENLWQKEWQIITKKNQVYLHKHKEEKPFFLNEKIASHVPAKLQDTLNQAFLKAFKLIYEKGNGIIEKTYGKEQQEQKFQVNEFTVNLTGKRKDLKAFTKQAGSRNRINLLLSGVEGIGMGLVGSGLPDIPLFTGVLLKSIYEIALSFGYEYESVRERIFILKIIEGALESGENLAETDITLDEMIRGGDAGIDLDSQMTRTAERLSEELLYMKFLQGIPIAGVVGGLSDTVYLKKITEYAHLKYYKRFVYEHIHIE